MSDTKPEWWTENERIREEMDLPPYEPPAFADGTYVHEVVEPLEAAHGVRIQFVGLDTRYPEDWEIRVDGEPVAPIGHRRNENGNTVFGMDPDGFRATLRGRLGDG